MCVCLKPKPVRNITVVRVGLVSSVLHNDCAAHWAKEQMEIPHVSGDNITELQVHSRHLSAGADSVWNGSCKSGPGKSAAACTISAGATTSQMVQSDVAFRESDCESSS